MLLLSLGCLGSIVHYGCRYSPEQLYEVVSSVQHYSQFVPWCVGSHVLKREQEGRYLEAELQIGFQMISERCGVWVAWWVGITNLVK